MNIEKVLLLFKKYVLMWILKRIKNSAKMLMLKKVNTCATFFYLLFYISERYQNISDRVKCIKEN